MFAPKDAEQLAEWNPYDQNAVSPFFDAEWMFNAAEGFDIVIGNPPYIQLQKDSGKLANLYESQNFKSFAKKGDIYCLFYEKGCNLLNSTGRLCFITSNKWMRAGYGEKLRDYFAKNVNPKLLVDFAGVKVFESATVDTNILLFEKGKNEGKTLSCTTTTLTKDGLSNLSDFVKQNSCISNFDTSNSWVILSPIEQSIKSKIEKIGTPLKDWDINIYRGVLTGYNDAFIISGEKRDEILANCKNEIERKKTAELIRPILRGRDIKRYEYNFADLYLINTHNGVKEKNIPRIDIKDYPAIKKHLDEYWEKIEKRADQGDTPYNLRNCAYMDLNAFPRFCSVPEGFYVVDSLCFFSGSDIEILVQELNSEFASYYFFNSVATLDNGGFQMRQQYVEEIPLPRLKTIKGSVDEEIYKAFNFTEEEIQFIKISISNKKKEIESLIK